ncbi:hypothetical protein [Fodinibius sp. SL11]|uniref:hypothetical protein n=1 Tax=Fodinibius sp. SL11 TaxID=3425690 RepID=UPI003F880F3D
MTTDSHFIDADETYPEGLGRLPAIRNHQLRPAIEIRTPVRTVSGSRRPSPNPRVTPIRKRSVLDPVIEHRSPIPAPRRITVKPKKKPSVTTNVKTQSKQKSTAKTSSQKKKRATKPTSPAKSSSPSPTSGFLDGSITIGGMQIKKTHAAAGGATVSGLLLWKLLF